MTKQMFDRNGKELKIGDLVRTGTGNGAVDYQIVSNVKPVMSTAVADVLAERARQITEEGWTPEHDDKHDECQLATAAACYCVCDSERHLSEFKIFGVPVWPWAKSWWKSTTYRRNLVKAAALILAEIERIDRKEKK